MGDERFDGLLINIAQQHDGIDSLLHTFFGFLDRKTDFFTFHDDPAIAEKKVAEIVKKHAASAVQRKKQNEALRKKEQERQKIEDAAKKASKAEQDARTKTAEEPQLGIVEIDDSTPPVSEKKDKGKAKEEAPVEDVKMGEAGEESREEKAVEDGKQAPNPGNGGKTKDYTWTQTLGEVDLVIELPAGTPGKFIDVDVTKTRLKVTLKGKDSPLVDGELHKPVNPDETLWSVEDRKSLMITLEKVNKMEWWNRVLVGDVEIDTQKVQPENSKLSDLDFETRGKVEEMMYNSRQKAMGLPTSEDAKKQEMIKKFMAANPQMDFSQAKIG